MFLRWVLKCSRRYDAFKNQSYGKNRGKQGRKAKHHPILSTVGPISITSWSPFSTYYIPFRRSGSQESNASDGVQIGVETKKLWSLQENWTELSGNFAHLNPRCEIHSKVRKSQFKVHQFRTPLFKVRIPQSTVREFRTPPFSCANGVRSSHTFFRCAKISHTPCVVRIFPCFCRLHTRSFLLDIFV